ncbi:MAG: putative phage abortive infection protein [Bacteroides cellulosilyticus]|nr:putative phage abortive infection protein [Bacteroides cellulosilyticus]
MNKQKNKTSKWEILAWILIIFGAATTIYFMCCPPFNDGSGVRNPELFAKFGDFIGGFIGSLFTLVSIFLLIATLNAQRESIKSQNEDIRFQHSMISQERFETTFFNLLNVQQKILDDLNAQFYYLGSNSYKMDPISVTKREIFKYIKIEIKRIEQSLKSTHYEIIYDGENNSWEDLMEQIRLDYKDDNQAIKRTEQLKKKLRYSYVNYIYKITETQWKQVHKRQGKYLIQSIYYIFFRKYHFNIGHYFRHLYHILKFIRQYEQQCLDVAKDAIEKEQIKKQCHNYSQFVQAQMATDELTVMYYNSLCYPKMAELIKHFNLLENLTIHDLIRSEHYLEKEGYILKEHIMFPNV